jgi:hypothetical protein
MRSIIISCGIATEQEDKILISLDGLTKKEKKMLQIMWSIDSKEQLQYWVSSLNKRDRITATSLLMLIKYEMIEHMMDDDYLEANEVLSKFTLSE